MTEHDGTEQEPGWNVRGTFYPVVPAESFRMGTPILVRNVTDLTWGLFMDEIDVPKDDRDPTVIIGLLAASVYKAERKWSRSDTAKFIESLDNEDVQFVGALAADDDEDAEGDAGPPSLDGESSSTDSPPESNGTAVLTSLKPNLATSGQPASTTGAPASPPTGSNS